MQAGFQSVIPDVWLAEDGLLNLILNIEAGQIEGVYLANQIVLQDMFVQTASLAGLQRFGEQFGVAQKVGTSSVGSLLFAGGGGIYIPIGAEVAFDPGGGADPLYFVTTQDGTLPDPGIPNPPSVVDASIAGALTGTFEWAVSFLTAAGETLPSQPSAALVLAASQANLTNIPLGGPGTTGRQIYRSQNGGLYQLVHVINDNVTTIWTDNQASAISGEVPETVSGAERITLTAQSEQNGVEYNAVVGAINILTNVPDGITSVTNPNPFTAGSDPESIDDYRIRLLNWIRSPQTGSSSDLENWALTIPGVAFATAFPNDNNGTPTNGYTTVRIAGAGGAIPGADVVASVLSLLQQKTLADITIVVTTFTPTTLAVAVTITPASGFTTVDLTPSVQQSIQDYINSVDVAGTVYLSGIVQSVRGVNGVLDVVVTAPGSNQTAAAAHKFVPGTITVS